MIEKLIEALDLQQGSWYISLADPRDLQDYAEATSRLFVGRSRLTPAEATYRLKKATAERLFVVLRAAVHSELLVDPTEEKL